MRVPDANCPECNSVQRFAAKERVVSGNIEIYMACHACGFERIIDSYPAEQRVQRGRERVRKLRQIRRGLRWAP